MRFSLSRSVRTGALIFAGVTLLCMLSSLLWPTTQYAGYSESTWLNWGHNQDSENQERAHAVRRAFIHAWKGYKDHAFPHDMLLPLSNKYEDDRSGWGCTAVDALTAAILLEVPEIVETSVNHIAQINWNKVSSPKVSIFGTTIRYLGSMLSAYDLLTTTHTNLTAGLSHKAVQSLLTQSKSLADALSVSFSTPTNINHNQLLFPEHTITPGSINDITAISGLVLEWTHLSDLTGNRTYAELAQKNMKPLLDPGSDQVSPFPGLLPKFINTTTGEWLEPIVGGWSHAGGGMYEMLLKLSIYDPDRFGGFRDRWKAAAESTMTHLASHPRDRPDLTFLADFNGTKLVYQADHSGMFAASSFILGGAVTGEARYLNFGLELLRSYVKLYRSTATGIGPESWGWIPDTCKKEVPKKKNKKMRNKNAYDAYYSSDAEEDVIDENQATLGLVPDDLKEKEREECVIPESYAIKTPEGFTEEQGVFMTNLEYRLRPEVLESLYYAYRVTKDERYRDWSWRIFLNIREACRARDAFAELDDVNLMPRPGSNAGRENRMPSWTLAETFMYAYIIHIEDAPWHVRTDNSNDWIFSTQAHPMKIDSRLARS